jgi:hypothetical protein
MSSKRTTRPVINVRESGVVAQIKFATKKQNRLAMICGALLGAFVPVATFVIAHLEVAVHPWMWLAVAGGLGYSALTVFEWARSAVKHPVKAAGFVLILEGAMTFSSTIQLAFGALAVLVAVNGVATGVNLAIEQKVKRASLQSVSSSYPLSILSKTA